MTCATLLKTHSYTHFDIMLKYYCFNMQPWKTFGTVMWSSLALYAIINSTVIKWNKMTWNIYTKRRGSPTFRHYMSTAPEETMLVNTNSFYDYSQTLAIPVCDFSFFFVHKTSIAKIQNSLLLACCFVCRQCEENRSFEWSPEDPRIHPVSQIWRRGTEIRLSLPSFHDEQG